MTHQNSFLCSTMQDMNNSNMRCNTRASLFINLFLSYQDLFANSRYQDMGNMEAQASHIYCICYTQLQNHILHWTGKLYMLIHVRAHPTATIRTIASMWLSSRTLWCDAWCWGTSDERTFCSKQVWGVWTSHFDTMLFLWSYSTMISTHL